MLLSLKDFANKTSIHDKESLIKAKRKKLAADKKEKCANKEGVDRCF